MSSDPYSSVVRELFADPAHVGQLADTPGVLVEDQGVRIAFSAKVVEGRIDALRFQAWGCPHVIAAVRTMRAKVPQTCLNSRHPTLCKVFLYPWRRQDVYSSSKMLCAHWHRRLANLAQRTTRQTDHGNFTDKFRR